MSKVLAVFGATGQQGGSVASYVAKEVPSQYKVRAITRDPSKPAALKLKDLGIEVVAGDANDENSLELALKGADTVFAMSAMSTDGKSSEFKDGKAIADAAVKAGASFFIWSTLPPVSKLSNGELTHVEHFDDKAKVEEYVRSLPIKSAFYSPGIFLQNFHGMMKPHPTENGYAIMNIMDPKVTLPWVDITKDTGKFVGQILKKPDTFAGKTLYGAGGHYSLEDISKIISKVSKRDVGYTQIPEATYRSFMPPAIVDDITEMFKWHNKFGYFGPKTKELVNQSLTEIDFKPTTAEEYFEANPISFSK
jgi:uncharacterized protein YbjT (DUF2867 family)